MCRNKMPESWRTVLSRQTCLELEELSRKSVVRIVHSFLPFGTEINIFPFLEYCLENQIKVITPKILKKPVMIHLETPDLNQLRVNKMGIRESACLLAYEGPYDLILVPGVVFARNGYRIGYGGGYYDYFLARHPEALKIGVGFPLQLVEKLPHAAYDIPVNRLILGDQQLII